MNTFNTNEMNQQFDNVFMAPARAYAALTIDYAEKMLNAQMEASQAYTDAGIQQLRQLSSVKDPQELRRYMEGQQQVVKQMAERAKGDADKVVSLQQDYFQKSQKLTQESVKQAQTAASTMRQPA
ncbi:phasin family protein [Vreelandella populi]|uniref:Phasin family protein n=1 Tax=Vreelandella populi TaxID=2498858 RepID=A0A433LGT9_9GAMM|nr:phasin family protein [Halomonas populi]RUR40720.1 phasin family protein [Halomonas populi]RUR49227.1 phasin family protein [Halomonas populi]